MPKNLNVSTITVWNKAPALEVRNLWSYTAQFITKRVIDFLAAGLGLIILSPLMLGISLLIRLDSEGPVFFRQQRLGRGGKPFLIWKFRIEQKLVGLCFPLSRKSTVETTLIGRSPESDMQDKRITNRLE